MTELGDLAIGEGAEQLVEEYTEEPADAQAEVSSRRKRVTVSISKHPSEGFYFRDAKGYKKDTTKKEWVQVDGGYELKGGKHIYFMKRFP